ncbi:MAG: hypothetical protein ACTHYC_13375 [Sphingobacterium sp.]
MLNKRVEINGTNNNWTEHYPKKILILRLSLLMCIVIFSNTVIAQRIITGQLLDQDRKPVTNVSVSYKKIGSEALLGFSRSDSEGNFKIESRASNVDSIQLDFHHMSYTNHSVIVPNKSGHYAYSLTEEVRKIEEVNADNLPIFKRKDTINFNVEAFTSKQDRVIADIIKKLPGIEMDGDRILYQGKPIQKYMVNNLDLMEGRYSMINKNLPAEAVKNVQVVENDQPLKILDSVVFSDRASLNLELRKFTTTGSGKVGIGAAPLLWDVNLTPMTFGNTFQMLNSFQSNNVGVNVSQDLRPLYTASDGYFVNRASAGEGPSYIELRNVPSPGFEERKWLDNKVFMFSANMLQKLNNGLDLKGNISYYDDTRIRRGFTATQVFAADEVIVNDEVVDNRYRVNNLNVGAILEKNEKDIFLKNLFQYHKRWDSDQGDVLLNQEMPIQQYRLYTDEALMNSLSLGRFIGKQLVNITSNLEWHRTPQRLRVMPGQFEEVFNNGDPFDGVDQIVNYDDLNWENNIGFSHMIKRWRLSPNISLNYNRTNLKTDIERTAGGEKEVLGGEFHNDMRNSQLQLGVDLGMGWENRKWKLHLSTPYNVYYFNVKQQGQQTLDNAVRNTFNPSANLNYLMDATNEFNVNVSGGNEFDGLNNFYNGFIFREYRNIQRYNARLLGTQNFNTGIGYNYKNTLKANFANVRYEFAKAKRDYIYETLVDSLGRLRTTIGDRNSGTLSHNLRGGVSRFFPKIKTVVKLNGNMSWSGSDYLVNDVMARQKTFSYGSTFEVINNVSSVVAGEYKTTLGRTMNRLAEGRSNNVFYNNHYLSLFIYPIESHSITLSNSYYRNNISRQRDQYFLDAVYRFTIGKKKIDIELIAQNLLNNDDYVQQFSSDYELIQTTFELRPRQFLISTKFRF